MFFERQKSSESSEKKRKKFRKIRQYVFERKTSSESSDKKFRKFGEKVQTKCFWKAKKFREFRKKSSESSEKKKVQKVLEKSSFFLSKKFSDSIVQINFRKTKKSKLDSKKYLQAFEKQNKMVLWRRVSYT